MITAFIYCIHRLRKAADLDIGEIDFTEAVL